MELKDRLRETRLERGMTLEGLAKAVGTSKQTIHRYETGAIANIPSDKIEAIAGALKTTPAYLMGWEADNPVDIIVDMFSETDERISYIVEVFDNSTEKQKAWLYYCAKMLEEDK